MQKKKVSVAIVKTQSISKKESRIRACGDVQLICLFLVFLIGVLNVGYFSWDPHSFRNVAPEVNAALGILRQMLPALAFCCMVRKKK